MICCAHNPKEYSEVCPVCYDQLRQRAETAEKERDKAKIQFGCCSVCGYVAWKEQVVNSQTVEVCQYCELNAKVQPLVDALRDLLEHRDLVAEHNSENVLKQWDNPQNHQ